MPSSFFETRALIRYTNIKNVISQFGSIDYAIIKGEPLSYFAYGAFGQRESNDIDILIPHKSLDTVQSILIKNGFSTYELDRQDKITMATFSHQLTPYVKEHKICNIIIDLNYDIFWGEYTGKRVDISNFLSDTIPLTIYGCRVQTLPPLKSFIQLVLHHYKEMNSIYHLATHKCIRHVMFSDVYYLWKNWCSNNIQSLYELCLEYDIIPFVYYILYYTNEIFKDKNLKIWVDKFKTSDGTNLLNCYGLTDTERKMWKIDFNIRLESQCLFDFIKDDLDAKDLKKLEWNRKVFG